MKLWKHECIILGPSDDIQGFTIFFGNITGIFVKYCTIEELPNNVSVIRKMYQWVTQPKIEEHGNKLQFFNRSKQHFDWDNDERNNHEELFKDLSVSHPGVPDELPGIGTCAIG